MAVVVMVVMVMVMVIAAVIVSVIVLDQVCSWIVVVIRLGSARWVSVR